MAKEKKISVQYDPMLAKIELEAGEDYGTVQITSRQSLVVILPDNKYIEIYGSGRFEVWQSSPYEDLGQGDDIIKKLSRKKKA
jgi:hypothetical protein